MTKYSLEKYIWTENDFEVMGWHDSRIHGIASYPEKYEVMFDLDYLFSWVHPQETKTYFKFWVSPCTLLFEFVATLDLDIEAILGEIDIDGLEMNNPYIAPDGKTKMHEYKFICQQGEIILKAKGYKMFVKRNPVLLNRQILTQEERLGINFERGLLDRIND